jgi:epoxyqueuosine reductase
MLKYVCPARGRWVESKTHEMTSRSANPHRDDRLNPMESLTDKIRQFAHHAGFDLIGFVSADRRPGHEEALRSWLAAGYSGEMHYMARDPSRRADPKTILPQAKTVICLGMNYYPGNYPPKNRLDGKVSRYAWGRDYHLVIEEKLDLLETYLRKEAEEAIQVRRYVDYGPFLERAYAARAGLGFIGKNTMLITQEFGSWVFLAELITDLELVEETVVNEGFQPASECGSCSLCIDACPTGAIVAPFKLDARKCISYLTIENKGEIPRTLQNDMQDWIFGCDICQEVCPYNHQPLVTANSSFSKGAGPWLNTRDILAMDQQTFKACFQQTPLLRPKHSGLQRNARAVEGNLLNSNERPE